ncbi:hypothetical protein C463_11127 [Halorubrum californiense DSM 19288]|uniref:Uncharacterized protein n=1 Tax=Halorubrum californiense DSM 19288 TaxID=1227465 RepID=M0E6Y3_9EURY|nr:MULTISPECIES: hypothetical protein [Halorubrum]ELZ42124.1 hypothetical protein C463_11127 [Halorubrum californiense DSM 19288]TKX65221.1 hypothetical protein EXE40_17055 [Halorubrum sp. GN11GM_10-3_MGM]
MRNPWVHDDVPDGAGNGYDGPVRLLAAFMWGTLALFVGGFVLLSGAGVVDLADGGSLGEVVTGVVAALALALALPILLKLLAISRVLAVLAFLGAGASVGRFVIAREPERFRALLNAWNGLVENAGSLGGLFDFVDSMSPAVVDAVPLDAAAAVIASVPVA